MSDRVEHFAALSGPHKRGRAAEALIKAAFLLRDIPVSAPEYDNEPYDFLIELNCQFYRIQAKTAYEGSAGTVQFETLRTTKTAEGYRRRGYADEIDFFAVFDPYRDEIYLVPIEEAASGKMEIRVKPTRNNQSNGVNWYGDYLLDHRLRGFRTE